jgi:hypothetical protein
VGLDPFTTIKAESEKMRAHPWSVLIILAVGFGAGMGFMHFWHGREITILEGEVRTLREKISLQDMRFQAKDEEAGKYRSRVEQLDKASANLSKATDSELRVLALELVKRIRDFANEYDDGQVPVSNRSIARMSAAKTDEERMAAWDKMIAEGQLVRKTRAQQYNRRFKVDVLLMRDELRSRIVLPDGVLRPDSFYELGGNATWVELLAVDLESLANKLPR